MRVHGSIDMKMDVFGIACAGVGAGADGGEGIAALIIGDSDCAEAWIASCAAAGYIETGGIGLVGDDGGPWKWLPAFIEYATGERELLAGFVGGAEGNGEGRGCGC